MMKIDPAEALREAVAILSQAEIERAWQIGEAANRQLAGGSVALKAEVAACLLAEAFAELCNCTKRPDDLADVLPISEGLAMYLMSRVSLLIMANASSA